MLLLEYRLENFGVFKGSHVFDLRTASGRYPRPVILFGGMNGSGKTTLFDGVKLCLYGRYAKGYKFSDAEYKQYLQEKIHRRGGMLESEGSSVSLEFEHVHLGQKSRYFVKRSWTMTGNSTDELTVLKDGRPVEGIPTEQLQDFLIELIPIGLSKLFFFDGERIQDLAEDDEENSHFADAFNTLLGLDILQHLQTDLAIHLSRNLRIDEGKILSELSRIADDRKALDTELEVQHTEKGRKQNAIGSVVSEIERQERGIAAAGGGFASQRTNLKESREVLTREISQQEDHIRELASSLLPFAIVPELCKRLKQTLIEEEDKQRVLFGNELLYRAVSNISSKSKGDEFWRDSNLSSLQREETARRFIQEIKSMIQVTNSDDLRFLHQISRDDERKMLNWIDQAVEWIPLELRDSTLQLEAKIGQLRVVEESLAAVPPEETLAPYIRELNSLHERLGVLRSEMNRIEESIHQLIFKQKELDRFQLNLLEEQNGLRKDEEATELAQKVQKVLGEFSVSLKKRKLEQVSTEFIEAFNILAAKKGLVERIDIDGDRFSVKIFRKDGVTLNKEQLSAGERQIYAISMLMALARVSGRPLPFMIDTPLARLDSQHRENLVKNFFPKAAILAVFQKYSLSSVVLSVSS